MPHDETQKHLVKERFDREGSYWQAIYGKDDFISQGFVKRQKLAVSLVPPAWNVNRRKALELGCGAGFASLELASRGFYVTGLDISERMINIARKNWERSAPSLICHFEIGDFDEVNLKENSFDVVVALGFMEYLPNQVSSIEKIHRILKTNGIVVVTVPNNLRLCYIFDPLRNFSLKRYTVIIAMAILPSNIFNILLSKFGHSRSPEAITHAASRLHRNKYTPSSLDRLFESMGFAKVAHIGHQYGHFTFMGKRLFSDSFSQRIDNFLYAISRRTTFRVLQKFGNNYIASYRKVRKI